MKQILFLLLVAMLTSCTKYAPDGMAYVIELYDGEFIVAKNYKTEPDGFTVKYIDTKDLPIKTHFVVNYKPNLLYEAGYKKGQIDAENGNICFVRVATDNGEILWKDTCSVKRKVKID